MKLSTIFLPVVLSGAPGTGFFDEEQAYWPVLSCESDKGCSVWKIAQKAGWEDAKAAKLTCDLSINKCVCADGFVDRNNDPRDGCEAEAGSSSDGETCYFGSCSDDSSCASFHPGLTCGSSGCCECDPDNTETLGNQQGCLKKQEEEPVVSEAEAQPRNGCPPNFNLAISDPLTCCHENAFYDNQQHKCMCNNQEVDENGFCKFCMKGETEFIDGNGEKRCCRGSQVWNNIHNSCMCQDLSIPGSSPFAPDECPGDCPKNPHWTHFHFDDDMNIVCCPEGASYIAHSDSCSNQCQCMDHNNNYFLVQDLVITHCPPLDCQFGYNPHFDTTTSSTQCCPGSSHWDESTQACVCQDGVEKPDLNNQCPDDCPAGEILGSFFPEMICCPPGTSYMSTNTFTGCACDMLTPWTAPDADGNCPFCAVNHHKQEKQNGDEICCKRNLVWNENLQNCACPDESMDQGFGCADDCPAGEYLYGVSLDGVNQCCPVGSYFDNSPCEQRCRCNDQNGPAGMYPHPERGCYACAATDLIAFNNPSNPSNPHCCKPNHYGFPLLGCRCPDMTDLGPRDECYDDCDPGFYISNTWNPDTQKELNQCCPVGSDLIYDSGAIECRCPNSQLADSVNSCTSCTASQIPFWQNPSSTTCCDANRRYMQMQGSCMCIDGSEPHVWTGCEGDCPAGSYVTGPDNQCCPIASDWDVMQEKCICMFGNLMNMEPQEINGVMSCEFCAPSMDIYYDNMKNPHCCPENQIFDGNQCMCEGGSWPMGMGECPGDCSPGTTYHQSPQLGFVCCPNNGFDWFDSANDKCWCQNGVEADLVNNVCPLCAEGKTPYEDQDGNTQCCPANQSWNDDRMMCICYDGSYPMNGDGECPGDCPYGFVFATNTPELVCCPQYAYVDPLTKECLCMPMGLAVRGIAPDPVTHLCPRCDGDETEYERKNIEGFMCCANNLVYDEKMDICTCPDGKQPYQSGQGRQFCKGDCLPGYWLAEIWNGENICCPVGSSAFPNPNNPGDITCTCYDGNPPDPVSGCPTPCGANEIPWDDSNNGWQEIACCEPRHVWFPWSYSCRCPGDYWGWNGGCEEDCPVGFYTTGNICCPVGANMIWDGVHEVCQCNDGNSPNGQTGCGVCSEKENAYMDTNGNQICCQKNMVFNYQNNMCECDGSFTPGMPNPITCEGDCDAGKWIQHDHNGDEICCAIGSWYDMSQQKCTCNNGIDPDPETGCGVCGSHLDTYFDNSGNTVCCEKHQTFSLEYNQCRCEDCSEPVNDLHCPGECPAGQVLVNTYPEKQCCPVGAYWTGSECECSNGTPIQGESGCNLCSFDTIAHPTIFGHLCCRKNQIVWNNECRCPDKSMPGNSWYPMVNGNSHIDPQQCDGDCPYGYRLWWKDDGDFTCCPGDTNYMPFKDECECPNQGVYDEENQRCPFCGINDVEYRKPDGYLMCCQANLVQSDSGYECVCSDGSNPYQNSFNECPGDCDVGEYLADFRDGVKKCCPVGSYYDIMAGECLCQQREGSSSLTCVTCPSGQVAYQTYVGSGTICCPTNQVYDFNMHDCRCSDGNPPSANGACPDDCDPGYFYVPGFSDIICCLEGTSYNVGLEICQCPDGSEPPQGGSCPFCPSYMTTHSNQFGDPHCCFSWQNYSIDQDKCICPDGSPLGPYEMCNGTCDDGELLAQFNPPTCCPIGTVLVGSDCECADPSKTVSSACGFCPSENSNIFLSDSGNIECCQHNHVWHDQSTGCACPDLSPMGAYGSCPGDCGPQEIAAGRDETDTLICCPIGASYNGNECECDNGNPITDDACPVCPPNRDTYYFSDGTGFYTCCPKTMKHNEIQGCVCQDDSLSFGNQECPGDCNSDELVASHDPQLICCKAGEYYDRIDGACKCPNNDDNADNNACGFCSPFDNPGVDGITENIHCCAANHQFSKTFNDCRCPDESLPHPLTGCPGDCDAGQIIGAIIDGQVICCPEDSTYNFNEQKCECDSGFEIIDNTCPVCPPYLDTYIFSDGTGFYTCCPKTMKHNEIQGCVCQDDSLSFGNNECPGDCNSDELVASHDPQLICCKAGEYYDRIDGACKCPNNDDNADNNACGFCSPFDNPGVDGITENIHCCAANHQFSKTFNDCRCPDESLPDPLTGCPGDCDAGQTVGAVIDGQVICCPEDSSFNFNEQRCVCHNGFEIIDNTCPVCSEHKDAYYGSMQNLYCCFKNQELADDDSGCVCKSDGSFPNQLGCPGDCPDGEYLAFHHPLQCCEIGAMWDFDSQSCKCPNDNPLDGTGCGLCQPTENVGLHSSGNIHCCLPNHEFSYTFDVCRCPDDTPIDQFGGCPGDCDSGFYVAFISSSDGVLCCPDGTGFDPAQNTCTCNNGAPYDAVSKTCPPCSPPLVAQYDGSQSVQCCQLNHVWSDLTMNCMCADGEYPNPNNQECGDECEAGFSLKSIYPTLECCPYNSWWNMEEEKCECSNGDEPDETACGICPISDRAYLDKNDIIQCCPKNLFWFDEDDYTTQGCYCEDGKTPVLGNSGYLECADDCDPGTVFIEPGVCCPIGSSFNPSNGECECFNGSFDDACGNCPPGQKATLDSNNIIRCCPKNLFWFEGDGSNQEGCYCEDRTDAYFVPPANQLQCDGDCAQKSYLIRTDPDTFCCPWGSVYNPNNDECECPNGWPSIDDGSACGLCGANSKPHLDEFGSIQCCPGNLFWFDFTDVPATMPSGCFCEDRTTPEMSFSGGGYPQCENDCAENHVLQFMMPYSQCCPFNSVWNYNLNKCECPNGEEPGDRACGQCALPDKAHFDEFGGIQCCQRNLFWFDFDQDTSEPSGCFCQDRKQATFDTQSNFLVCENDCATGEYFIRPDPTTTCCPIGSTYNMQTKTCICNDNNSPPVDGKCSVCPAGYVAFMTADFGADAGIECCKEGHIWHQSTTQCACPGGSVDLPCPVSPPVKEMCSEPLVYNFNKGECECWDGTAPVDGACSANACAPGENAFYDRFNNLKCCSKNAFYNKDRMMCLCVGEQMPTSDGSCPVCAPGETPFTHNDAVGCCKEDSHFDMLTGSGVCRCNMDGMFVSDDTICSPYCQPYQIHIKDVAGMGPGWCEDFCVQGQIYDAAKRVCVCPDGYETDESMTPCPPPSNCQIDFIPYDSDNGQVCCHKDAYFRFELGRCICNDGSEPNMNQVCEQSCPDELVYTKYPQTGEMACLCPETFQYPNIDGVCMPPLCYYNEVLINFDDGSYACCPEGSTWSSQHEMCICIHQGMVGQCGEKCPDNQISVYNHQNGATECQFVSCDQGLYPDHLGNCCPLGQVFSQDQNACACPDGQLIVGGVCESVCPPGSDMDNASGQCVSKCQEGQIFRDEKCFCADGSEASPTKPCCKIGQYWSAEKGICVCDGGVSCNEVCPETLPNKFVDVFGEVHCCSPDQVFNVRTNKCMCMRATGATKFFEPVDRKCSCAAGEVTIQDGDSFRCEPSICSPDQVVNALTGLCECPSIKPFPFENDFTGEIVCCPEGQKWSNKFNNCVCIEGNMLTNANGDCEEIEECPPGWYFSGNMHEYGTKQTQCVPICPPPAMVWFVESPMNPDVSIVTCKCKGDYRYSHETDLPMVDYVAEGECMPEMCPDGMIRSQEIATYNECVCPYHWQTVLASGGCSCDHPHYSMFFNTCSCKENVFSFQTFSADGTCECPIGYAYNEETHGCKRDDCYFFDTESQACMTKEQFEETYTLVTPPPPLTQIDDQCPGFEVGWKGIKSSRVVNRAPDAYRILTNVKNNQDNVDVTQDDYIGFIVYSKRYCGFDFLSRLQQGGATVRIYDTSDSYNVDGTYVSLDKSQTQTVIQFSVQHDRNPDGTLVNNHLNADGVKKDQFYLDIAMEPGIEFLYGTEFCLTSFNIGVMKSAMTFGENYTYCVPNGGTIWWSKPNIDDDAMTRNNDTN